MVVGHAPIDEIAALVHQQEVFAMVAGAPAGSGTMAIAQLYFPAGEVGIDQDIRLCDQARAGTVDQNDAVLEASGNLSCQGESFRIEKRFDLPGAHEPAHPIIGQCLVEHALDLIMWQIGVGRLDRQPGLQPCLECGK